MSIHVYWSFPVVLIRLRFALTFHYWCKWRSSLFKARIHYCNDLNNDERLPKSGIDLFFLGGGGRVQKDKTRWWRRRWWWWWWCNITKNFTTLWKFLWILFLQNLQTFQYTFFVSMFTFFCQWTLKCTKIITMVFFCFS